MTKWHSGPFPVGEHRAFLCRQWLPASMQQSWPLQQPPSPAGVLCSSFPSSQTRISLPALCHQLPQPKVWFFFFQPGFTQQYRKLLSSCSLCRSGYFKLPFTYLVLFIESLIDTSHVITPKPIPQRVWKQTLRNRCIQEPGVVVHTRLSALKTEMQVNPLWVWS